MPKKDLNSFGSLVGDLWRETSFAVFFCTVGGMILGVLVTVGGVFFWIVAMTSMVPVDTTPAVQGQAPAHSPPVTLPFRFAFLLTVPGAVVGGVVGCLFGALIDFLVNLIRGPKKKRVGKKWDPEREAARRERRRSPPTDERGDVGEHWDPGTNYQRRPD